MTHPYTNLMSLYKKKDNDTKTNIHFFLNYTVNTLTGYIEIINKTIIITKNISVFICIKVYKTVIAKPFYYFSFNVVPKYL